MQDNRFNGWATYETWQFVVCVDNTYNLYEKCCEYACWSLSPSLYGFLDYLRHTGEFDQLSEMMAECDCSFDDVNEKEATLFIENHRE